MAFVKTTWNANAAPGITAAQLNRIETGIADAHDAKARPVGFRGTKTVDVAWAAGYGGPVGFDREDWDSDNWFDGTKFQPTRAGWYRIGFQLVFSGMGSGVGVESYIAKNFQTANTGPSASTYQGDIAQTRGDGWATTGVTTLVQMNGTTDYLTVYGWIAAAGTLRGTSNDHTVFEGELVGAL